MFQNKESKYKTFFAKFGLMLMYIKKKIVLFTFSGGVSSVFTRRKFKRYFIRLFIKFIST